MLIFFPIKVYTQANISLTGQVGLVNTDGNLGRLIYVSSDISFNSKYGIELGFSYIEIEEENNNSYITNKYSILAEHYIRSDDKRFQITGKTGPSFLSYHNSEDYKSTLGLDLGLDISYAVLGPLSINLGLMTTLNSNTKLLSQTYFGLSYNFNFKRKEKY